MRTQWIWRIFATTYVDPPDACFFLAFDDDGEIIGTGALRPYDHRFPFIEAGWTGEAVGEMSRFYIEDRYRRQGIGGAIYTREEAFARQAGYHSCYLHTSVYLPTYQEAFRFGHPGGMRNFIGKTIKLCIWGKSRYNVVIISRGEAMRMEKVRSDGYSMATIPAGLVHMRDDRTKKSWSVDIPPFLLGTYPVTGKQYISVVHANRDSSEAADAPVTDVSWYDAIRYCNALSLQSGLQLCYSFDEPGEQVAWDQEANGYRLPTEAEWQYACKAGSDGYQYGSLDEIAWYGDNAEGHAHEVGQKQPNGWGLYDMLGNVWEWCWDMYDPEVYGPYRVFRGGSWAEAARGCGATCRRRSHPTFHIDDLGFRLARSL